MKIKTGGNSMVEFPLQNQCKRCGRCCTDTFSVSFTHPLTDDERLLLTWKGWVVEGDQISITTKCKYLSTNNLCTIYESRPLKCQNYFCEKKNGDPSI